MKATIDRIEEGVAVLISRDYAMVRITVPGSLLPAGSCEGDVITFNIERDAEDTLAVKERVTGLIEKLKKG